MPQTLCDELLSSALVASIRNAGLPCLVYERGGWRIGSFEAPAP